MTDLWTKLKQRKLVQWALAYVAFAFALLQGIDIVAQRFDWPAGIERGLIVALVMGFFAALVIAWYHGERGEQRVTGMEILLLAVLLAIGGGFLWQFTRASRIQTPVTGKPAMASSTKAKASAHPVALPAPSSTVIPAKSIAVLPFENLSSDKDNAYFADGMQDLILTKLADIGELKVISRTSTMKYASHPDDLRTIGKQLGVATILEGSVQKAGNSVLINVQLIDARSDAHLWANSYQRTLDNIFGVEGEVAGKIADALKAKLSPAEAAAVANVPTRKPAAYDAYLRGERFFNQAFSTGDFTLLPKAVAAYRQAVDHDPAFALAWSNLAFNQSLLNYTGIDRTEANCRKSLANARHALALQPDLPWGHLVLGYVYRFCFADLDRALHQFTIARKGLPNNAMVESAIAYIQSIKGDSQAAFAGLKRAVSLDPRNTDITIGLAGTEANLGRYDQARASLKRAFALSPDDPEVWSWRAHLAVLQQGDVKPALAILDRAPAALQSRPPIVRTRVELLLLKRDYAAARRAAVHLQPGGRSITPMRVALLRAQVRRLSGDARGAKAMYRQALTLARNSHAIKSGESALNVQILLPIAYAGLGQRDKALQAVDDLRAVGRKSGANLDDLAQLDLAKVHVLLGDGEAAIAPLDAALAAPLRDDLSVPLLKIDPFWDPIRKDPRFQALLAKYAHRLPDQARQETGHD
jgi:TolB-like protein/Tfp pilus assembly protein PilF